MKVLGKRVVLIGLAGLFVWLLTLMLSKKREKKSDHLIQTTKKSSELATVDSSKRVDWRPSELEMKKISETEAVLFGKVVDQDGVPVPGAEITCVPNRNPWASTPRRVVLISDESGLFSTRQPDCPSMSVEVAAAGYYSREGSTKNLTFSDLMESMPESLKARAVPKSITSPSSPEIFVLQKMASRDPLLSRNINGFMSEKQSFLIGNESHHSIAVRYWFDLGSKRLNSHGRPLYDWGVEIAVPEGGLVVADLGDKDNQNRFVAPEGGYSSSQIFSYQAGMSDSEYRMRVNQELFVKFSDGTYGRIKVAFTCDEKRPFYAITGYYNPSGRRSTEYDPAVSLEIPSESNDKKEAGR